LEGLITPAAKEPCAYVLDETVQEGGLRPCLFVRARSEEEVLQMQSLQTESSVSRLLLELTLLFFPKKHRELAEFLYIVHLRSNTGPHAARTLHLHVANITLMILTYFRR
jgi:hypothetical protein